MATPSVASTPSSRPPRLERSATARYSSRQSKAWSASGPASSTRTRSERVGRRGCVAHVDKAGAAPAVMPELAARREQREQGVDRDADRECREPLPRRQVGQGSEKGRRAEPDGAARGIAGHGAPLRQSRTGGGDKLNPPGLHGERLAPLRPAPDEICTVEKKGEDTQYVLALRRRLQSCLGEEDRADHAGHKAEAEKKQGFIRETGHATRQCRCPHHPVVERRCGAAAPLERVMDGVRNRPL